jgi:lipoic acid synthetase
MTKRPLPIADDPPPSPVSALAPPAPLASAGYPPWLAVPAPSTERTAAVRRRLLGLQTVCEAARCPNQARCWSRGTATVMVMGPRCARACRFCHVPQGRPTPLDPDEPEHLARFAAAMALQYIVITAVDRDDLPDHGAAHLAACVRAVARRGVAVEVLIPDLGGDRARLADVVDAGPVVVAHNVETVARLSSRVRDRRASYATSLAVLEAVRALDDRVLTKSSLMLGLGENDDEVIDTLIDLRSVGVEIVTLGQYLRPSLRQCPVARWVDPRCFDDLARDAYSLGFGAVAAGAMVRSSFDAAALSTEARRGKAAKPRPPDDGPEGAGASGGTRTPTGLPAGI